MRSWEEDHGAVILPESRDYSFHAFTCVACLNAPNPKEPDMRGTEARNETAAEPPKSRTVDMKFEIVVIPVSDVEAACPA